MAYSVKEVSRCGTRGESENVLHAGKETCKRGPTLVLKTQERRHQKPTTGVSVAPEKVPMPSTFFLKTTRLQIHFSSGCQCVLVPVPIHVLPDYPVVEPSHRVAGRTGDAVRHGVKPVCHVHYVQL